MTADDPFLSATHRFLSPSSPPGSGAWPEGEGTLLRLSAGAAAHAVLILLVSLAASSALDAPSPVVVAARSLVWLGGGGGGGDDKASSPARARVETSPVSAPAREAARRFAAASVDTMPTASVSPVPLSAEGLRDLPGGVAPVGAISDGRGPGSGRGSDGGRGDGHGGGDGSGERTGFGYNQGGGFPSPGGDISWPRLLKEVSPRYTPEAMRARIEGVVVLEAVVRADGTVGRVRVRRSLDAVFGLDEAAVAAVKAWRFAPALRRGQPVHVVVPVEVAFTLR